MKIVPDPPPYLFGTVLQTAQIAFSSCGHSHEPLFDTCAGIIAEDALIHIERHLQSACEAAYRIYTITPQVDTGLHWSTVWAVNAAKALVEALLSGADDVVLPPRDAQGLFVPGTIRKTAEKPFGHFGACDLAMFNVRAGVIAEDALVHVSLYLQAAYATADEVCRMTAAADRGLHWAALHAIETASALVEALLEGAEAG